MSLIETEPVTFIGIAHSWCESRIDHRSGHPVNLPNSFQKRSSGEACTLKPPGVACVEALCIQWVDEQKVEARKIGVAFIDKEVWDTVADRIEKGIILVCHFLGPAQRGRYPPITTALTKILPQRPVHPLVPHSPTSLSSHRKVSLRQPISLFWMILGESF